MREIENPKLEQHRWLLAQITAAGMAILPCASD